jgi:hypothetical protein
MALDFCMLSADGRPEMTVPFGPDDHAMLFCAVAPGSLLSRASEYYEDTEFSSSEISLLLGELATITQRMPPAVDALRALCREAAQRGCGIVAVAD